MRIRVPFAAGFVVLLLLASSLGLLPHSVLPDAPEAAKEYIPPQFDKVLHFITFFALTGTFYFIIDTTRKRILQLTVVVCTFVLAVGSEVAQGLLDNGRIFDPYDIVANVLGSAAAVGLANAYHKRSIDRKRAAKYTSLAGEDDLELGEGLGLRTENEHETGQESGVMAIPHRSVEEELDNWDENAPDDWDVEDEEDSGVTKMTPATSTADSEEPNKKD